jgi:hypothetical protein
VGVYTILTIVTVVHLFCSIEGNNIAAIFAGSVPILITTRADEARGARALDNLSVMYPLITIPTLRECAFSAVLAVIATVNLRQVV